MCNGIPLYPIVSIVSTVLIVIYHLGGFFENKLLLYSIMHLPKTVNLSPRTTRTRSDRDRRAADRKKKRLWTRRGRSNEAPYGTAALSSWKAGDEETTGVFAQGAAATRDRDGRAGDDWRACGRARETETFRKTRGESTEGEGREKNRNGRKSVGGGRAGRTGGTDPPRRADREQTARNEWRSIVEKTGRDWKKKRRSRRERRIIVSWRVATDGRTDERTALKALDADSGHVPKVDPPTSRTGGGGGGGTLVVGALRPY